MRYIKSITQQKLSFLLAIYIGLFMNGAVFYRRFGSYAHDFTVWKGISAVVELAATVLVTFFLLRLLSLFGRRSWRILASLVVLFSAGASYYMTFLNVVIGYGIIASVMTTDIDLSKEVVGLNFILWLIAVSALPLILIWNNRCRYTLLRQLRTPGQRIRSLAVVVLAGIMVWAPIRLLDIQQKKVERATGVDLPSYGGVVANSYLPSNWLSALGLYAWARVDESSDNNSLLNPAKKFTYQAPQNVDDTYVVFIIGETTRWDHMGIFGYERNTTPKLAQEKNLAAFRGYSCDTATKLSLRCMFVRQGGAEDNPQRTLKEQNIFAVLKQLGFSSDLYAMQSEMWFYSNTMADNIAYREQIGAEPRNRGKPVDDMLLVDEMQQSLGRNPDGKHLIILHTKGSHFNYTQRYPRSFAQWKPECIGVGVEFYSTMALGLSDIKAQMGGLVYRGFVTGNGFKRLGDTLRYLQAIEKRLEKLAIDPHRDRAQMLKVENVQQAWQQWINKLPPARREDEDVKEVRWMIEELRVSYFAQQLGTPYPISDKRILQAMEQISG